MLNFTIALRYSSVDKPSDYSEENMTKLTQSLTAEYDAEEESGMDLYADTFQATKKAGTTPVGGDTVTKTQPTNLICIMNESFTDMSIYDKLQINGETLPFYNSLSENTIKGWMYSPVTGGGTANVEYEFLTGNSTAFLPSGTVPYQLYVKDRQASLVSLMSELGYETTAFHPYVSSGWNRSWYTPTWGLTTKFFEDDMQNPGMSAAISRISQTTGRSSPSPKRQAENLPLSLMLPCKITVGTTRAGTICRGYSR